VYSCCYAMAGLITIFYCLRFETPPTWRVRSQYIYPSRTVWFSYTPGTPTIPLLLFASYDQQGFGGGIRTRPHMGNSSITSPVYNIGTDRTEDTVPPLLCRCSFRVCWGLPYDAYSAIALQRSLPSEPLLNNGCCIVSYFAVVA
jgi:hypothetical protein